MINKELLTALEDGKQIGACFSIKKEEREFIYKYGIQKHAGKYKVFVSKVEYLPDSYAWDEDNDYEIWDCSICNTVENASDLLSKYEFVAFDEMVVANKSEQFFKISFFY